MSRRSDPQTIAALATELAKAIEVIDSDAMESVCTIAQVHRFPWSGPTMDTSRAKELLAELEPARE